MTDAKPKRRWFQFSLKGLLIVMALSGLAIWYLAVYPQIEAQWFVEFMAKNPAEAEKLSPMSGMWDAMRKQTHDRPYLEAHPRSIWDKMIGRAVFTVALPIKQRPNGTYDTELIGTLFVVRGELTGPIELDSRPAKRQSNLTGK
jgi:hypothetical protein